MEPTEVELQTLVSVKDVTDWCGMSRETREGVETTFGLRADSHIRVVARLALADFQAGAANVQVKDNGQDRAPTLAESSQIALMWETSQFAAGIKKLSVVTAREQDAQADADRKHQLALAAAGVQNIGAGGGSLAGTQATVAASVSRTVSFEATIDTTDRKTEVALLTPQEVETAYSNYDKKMGSGLQSAEPVVPHPDEEPTLDQLTALSALVKSGAPPSVDFSVWRAHANRLKKTLTFSGMHIASDGKVVLAEIKGPASIEEWEVSWRLFRTACIMLKILSPAAADGYRDHIHRLHNRYGPTIWLMLYQTDVRFRSEHSERIRRRGEVLKARAVANNTASEFDPNQPWEYVFRVGPEDFAFWNREFEADAVLVRAHVEGPASRLGPDLGALATSGRSSGSSQPVHMGNQRDLMTPDKSNKGGGKGAKDRSRSGGWEQRNNDGEFASNRRGVQLCQEFQTGDCTEITRVNGAPMCAKDSSKVHQCAKCFGLHPARPKDGPPCKQPESNKQKKRDFGYFPKGRGKGGRRGRW